MVATFVVVKGRAVVLGEVLDGGEAANLVLAGNVLVGLGIDVSNYDVLGLEIGSKAFPGWFEVLAVYSKSVSVLSCTTLGNIASCNSRPHHGAVNATNTS